MTQRILLIDDSETDAILLKDSLAKAGLEDFVDHILSSLEGKAYLGGEGKYMDRTRYPLPDVLFLDLKMPVIDGFELLKWIKSQPALGRVIVIVLTGIEDTRKIQRAYELGAHSYLSKNANVEELCNIVSFLQGYARVASNLPKPAVEAH